MLMAGYFIDYRQEAVSRGEQNVKPKYYLTTAIDYVNARMHVGHAYEKIGADAIVRYKRMTGYNGVLLMGTDENS